MSDNELDNLFKEAAEGFKAPSDPSAWKDMSSKLDQAVVTGSFWNWKTISSLTLVGVTGIALVLYVTAPGSPDGKIASSDVTINQVIDKPGDNKSPIADNKSASITDNKSTISNNKTSISSQNMKEKNNLVAGGSNQSRSDTPSKESVAKSGYSLNSKVSDDLTKSPEGVQRASQQNESPSTQLTNEQNQSSIKESSVNNSDVISSPANKSGQAALVGGVVVTEKSLDSKPPSSSVGENQASVTTNSVKSNDEITTTENKSGQGPIIAGVVVTEKTLNSNSTGGPVASEKNTNQAEPNAEVAAGAAITGKSLDSKSSSAPEVIEKNSTQPESNASATTVQTKNTLVAADSIEKLEANKKEVTTSTLPSKSEKQPSEKESESINRFAVKLAIAPDYTTVKTATPNSLGINYGVLFEYKFTKHWSVATGGIWSKKIYSAYNVEYGAYTADWVDGDCRMWDIPVNVYYNFSSRKPFSFYASVGLSSYLMNEENYVYYVETPYGTKDYPKQIKGENNEWFKTLNISMGMQFRMSQRFSLQFEPTLKAPLAGVGEGEVSLVSLGAFFNLRYEIPIIKTRRNED